MNPGPFYTDWKFWSFVVSIIAIALSQLPPIHLLFKRAKLEVHVFGRILIHHKVGNPNANLLLSISNIGGKPVRVTRMTLSMKRGKEDAFEMGCHAYFQKQDDSTSLVFTPFKLKPGEEWGHSTQFYSEFPLLDEKLYRQLESSLKADIQTKRMIHGNPELAVVADHSNVAPLLEFFEKRFRWVPGEYDVVLTIEAEPRSAGIRKEFRFTLYESDSAELRARADEYKFGAGVYFHTANHDGLPVRLSGA